MSQPSPSVARRRVIRLEQVAKSYGREGANVAALRGVDLAIREGEFTAIVGRSGSGKSTLLHILGLIDAEYDGRYWLDDNLVSGHTAEELAALRNRTIGFVFQSFMLLPQLSIVENVELPALYARDRPAEECRAMAEARLVDMGLANRLDHKPGELSIGQRQRAAIARALVNFPRVILADEPTGALDTKTADEIMGIFHHLHRGGATIVMVTHDPDVAAEAERIIHVRDGETSDGLA